jgi:hypothetical protein
VLRQILHRELMGGLLLGCERLLVIEHELLGESSRDVVRVWRDFRDGAVLSQPLHLRDIAMPVHRAAA